MLWCCCVPQAETLITGYSSQGRTQILFGGASYQHSETQYAANVVGVRFKGTFGAIEDATGWFACFFQMPVTFTPPTSTLLRLVPWAGTGTRSGAMPLGFTTAVYAQRIQPKIQVRIWGAIKAPVTFSPPWDFFTPSTSAPTSTEYLGPVSATLDGQATTEVNVSTIMDALVAGPGVSPGQFVAFLIAPTTANYTSGPPWNPNEWSCWIAENDGSDIDGQNKATLIID